MWKSSKRLIINCIQSVVRCGRSNLEVEDLDDISDYDVQDVPVRGAIGGEGLIDIAADLIARQRNVEHSRTVQRSPVHFQPHTFAMQPRQEDLQHRPDAPGTRRTSPPEVVNRMLRALEEMGEPAIPSTIDKMHDDPSKSLKLLLHLDTPSTRR